VLVWFTFWHPRFWHPVLASWLPLDLPRPSVLPPLIRFRFRVHMRYVIWEGARLLYTVLSHKQKRSSAKSVLSVRDAGNMYILQLPDQLCVPVPRPRFCTHVYAHSNRGNSLHIIQLCMGPRYTFPVSVRASVSSPL
jgi:hypothetical protein